MSEKPPSYAEPFAELSHFEVHPPSVQILGYQYCLANSVVVLGQVDPSQRTPLSVGMLDPQRADLVAEISRVLGRSVTPFRLNAFEIQQALETGFGKGVKRSQRLTLKPVGKLDFDPQLPVGAALEEVLGLAIQLGASDVHLENYEDDVDVRFRIDGVLHQVGTVLSKQNISAAISRLKILSAMDIAERRRAQDSRILAAFQDEAGRRTIDFRLSVVPGPFGEDAVLRILDSAVPVFDLKALGMPEAVLPELERLIKNPEGMLLVVGPTGSGKTTTLYSVLNRIRSQAIKILTVEDPIEYHFDKINQKQVSDQMSFAGYARAFMRQNPDVILIGEIRDEETADVALRAAQTGHLVLSTLHTGEAVRTVSRLGTLGIADNLIASSLLGSLAQRILRRLCPECREQAAVSADEATRFRLPAGERLWYPCGCPACRGTGYRGRVGVFELFVPDEELADLIARSVPSHELRQRARQKGLRTLVEDALDKARQGITSLPEITRTIPYRIIEQG